jgi:hypothetical protein
MNLKQFFSFDWKRIFITSFLSILFLIINRPIIEVSFGIFFYLVIVGIPFFFVSYYYASYKGRFDEKDYNRFKNYLALISLFLSILIYYLGYLKNFNIFISILYWLLSILISFPLQWILSPLFQKMNILLNVKLPKIFWVIISILILLFFFLIFVFPL